MLSSHLGDPRRHPLTTAQLRQLADRVGAATPNGEDRDLECSDLTILGYGPDMARRIISLLDDEPVLNHYLHRGMKLDCVPVTRVSPQYPLLLRKRLGLDAPGCLWAKGDLSLLEKPAVALVGSRELFDKNREVAQEVGIQAAKQGYVLISGNARGADRTAQESCLAFGGQIISIVADELWKHPLRENVLYLSEDGFDEAFSAQRALSRNRCIHALGIRTFVAQSSLRTGGTWDGTVKNLRFRWSQVHCFNDGSEAMELLSQMGANPVEIQDLASFYDLPEDEISLF